MIVYKIVNRVTLQEWGGWGYNRWRKPGKGKIWKMINHVHSSMKHMSIMDKQESDIYYAEVTDWKLLKENK